MAPLGLEVRDPAISTPDGFTTFIQSEIDRWVRLGREAGLQLN